MAASDRKNGAKLLFASVTTLLLSMVVLVVRWGVNRVIVNDVDFSSGQSATTPSSIRPLLAGDVAAEIGDMVFLNDVRLQAGPQPQLFIVSGAEGTQMLIRLDSANRSIGAVAMKVDIKGMLRRLPAPEMLRKEWKLTKNQLHLFGQQQIYIAAEYAKGQSQSKSAD